VEADNLAVLPWRLVV